MSGYRGKEKNPLTGKYPIVFNAKDGYYDQVVQLPCGQCIGCRLERSRQWAIRCMHEASLYDDNCFVTLTYDDQHLPADRSLNKRHLELFLKKLRKQFGAGIRFYLCGEYGENFGRPHYHVCFFNLDFPDKVLWKVINGQRLYTSEKLAKIWGHGYVSIGSVTFESAAYVARYILKKVTGKNADKHYQVYDIESGEIFDRLPEFTNMSRASGIGKDWYKKYRSDVYPHDYVVVKGKTIKPPKYYDKLYEAEFPADHARLKIARARKGRKFVDNNTPERLTVREQVQLAKLKSLPRTLE